MKWRPWPALSCHPFVFEVGVSSTLRGVKWSLIRHNRSYSVKSADSGSRRSVGTRGSSCRRVPAVCPWVRGEVQKAAPLPWFWRWEGSFIVPTPNAAFASSCDASAASDQSGARQKKKKKGETEGCVVHQKLAPKEHEQSADARRGMVPSADHESSWWGRKWFSFSDTIQQSAVRLAKLTGC